MVVELWVWLATVLVIIGFFVFDFFSHVRVAHVPSLQEAGFWSAFYIAISIVFGILVWWIWGSQFGAEFFAGYLTEKALSVDNLFVFLIIMSGFAVPKIYQQKVLMIGIIMALIMRGIFIIIGAAIIEEFSWVFYLFGIFLIYTAWKLAQQQNHETEEEDYENGFMRLATRYLRTTKDYHADKFAVKLDRGWVFTPMFIVILAIGSADLLFAFDSIPAIFGLTQQPFIVFTANAFALMGLRQLYFLIGGLLERLVYLSAGLAFILAFIGVKLLLHAMHVNELPFINGGEPMLWVPLIPIWLSLTVIIGTITIAAVASLLKTRRDLAKEKKQLLTAEPD